MYIVTLKGSATIVAFLALLLCDSHAVSFQFESCTSKMMFYAISLILLLARWVTQSELILHWRFSRNSLLRWAVVIFFREHSEHIISCWFLNLQKFWMFSPQNLIYLFL